MSENREFPVVSRYFLVIKAADVLEVTDVRKVAPGLDRASTAFVARKSKDLKAMNVFCITQVMDYGALLGSKLIMQTFF